jgi:type I restriction-modification system DNA methylase subunit
MDTAQHNRIADFIWNIADDVLRDVYVRGKCRDVILPMVVVRRLDSVLEPTKDDVLMPKPLRTLAEIRADIEELERETEGLHVEILVEVVAS